VVPVEEGLMAAGSAFGIVRQSVVRRWLEVALPVYTLALLAVVLHPQYLPSLLAQSLSGSVLPWIGWALVGAMSGILILWGLIVAFFLAYSPFYLLGRTPALLGRGAWVDRRELQFYLCCCVLLCLLAAVFYWDARAGLIAFMLVSGCGPLFWRYLM
jgi:hypothetical protein